MGVQQIVKAILIFFGFILFLGLVFLGMQWFSNTIEKKDVFTSNLQNNIENALALEKEPAARVSLPIKNLQVQELDLLAPSVLSIDSGPNNQTVLYGKNEEEKLAIASLTKLMTALVVLENYDLSKKTIIKESAVLQEGDQGSLKPDQVLSFKNLLYIMLIESSNDAAYALADAMGVEKFVGLMNIRANSLRLKNTHFTDVAGLDEGSYSTARDLTTLTEYLLNNYPEFKEIIGTKELDLYLDSGQFHHKLITTDKLLGEVPEVIGGKTGWTGEAKGCLIIIENSPQAGNYLINVILGSADRFEEMKKLISWIKTAFTWK